MEENSFENGTELAELFNRSELARIRNGSLPSLKAARKALLKNASLAARASRKAMRLEASHAKVAGSPPSDGAVAGSPPSDGAVAGSPPSRAADEDEAADGRAKVATFAASWWQPGGADAATDPATDTASDPAADPATAPTEVAPGALQPAGDAAAGAISPGDAAGGAISPGDAAGDAISPGAAVVSPREIALAAPAEAAKWEKAKAAARAEAAKEEAAMSAAAKAAKAEPALCEDWCVAQPALILAS